MTSKAAKQELNNSKNNVNKTVDETTAHRGLTIRQELDQEKIKLLEKRVTDLTSNNQVLRQTATKTEIDTHDIVLYYNREMDLKDEIISRLNEELVKRETALKSEIESSKSKFENEINRLKTEQESVISDLKGKLKNAEAELLSVEIYRNERNAFEIKLQSLEKSLSEQKQAMFDALDDQERKFLEEKANLYKNLDEQKIQFRKIAVEESRALMGEEARRILSDNNRMHEELKFHHNAASDLQAEKLVLANQLSNCKRDIAILNDKELEYARHLNNKSKEIKLLRERIEMYEEQISVDTEKFRNKVKELREDVTKELEDTSVDAAGLRRLLAIKNKELRQMKCLSTTILSQRSEVEAFFLEALAEVKELMKLERQQEGVISSGSVLPFRASKAKLHQSHSLNRIKLNSLPSLSTVNQTERLINLDKVEMADMKWADKELVLKILFSKINGKNLLTK